MAKEYKPQRSPMWTSNRRAGDSSRSKAPKGLQTQALGVCESLGFVHHGVTWQNVLFYVRSHEETLMASQSFYNYRQGVMPWRSRNNSGWSFCVFSPGPLHPRVTEYCLACLMKGPISGDHSLNSLGNYFLLVLIIEVEVILPWILPLSNLLSSNTCAL